MAKQSLRTWQGREKTFSFWLVTVIGTGMLRPAPGTWGSLAGLAAGYIMIANGVDQIELAAWAIGLTIISSRMIDSIEAITGIHDAPEIVVDEVAGQWLALLPLIAYVDSPLLFGLAFLLFRLFDIVKPWPIGWLDRKVNGGFGVMIDDLVAGILAAITLWVLLIMNLLDWAV
ncbi:MAG: phosphatidylglycerophosphatase A [Alphaproteobacteria bacterium]|nr:phosphatidylglycerophosphatase A [Alphaproteobacteria bacterium]